MTHRNMNLQNEILVGAFFSDDAASDHQQVLKFTFREEQDGTLQFEANSVSPTEFCKRINLLRIETLAENWTFLDGEGTIMTERQGV